MPVITTGKFDNFIPPGVAAGQADGRHRGLRPAVAHPHLVYGGYEFHNQFGHLHLQWAGCAKAGSVGQGICNGFPITGWSWPWIAGPQVQT